MYFETHPVQWNKWPKDSWDWLTDWRTACHPPGHIVSGGMKGLVHIVSGHVVSGEDCLLGILSPGADCLQGRLSPSRADCLRGIIVSGADFLRAYCHPWNCVSFIQVICHTPLPSQIKVNLNLFWVKLIQLGSFLRKNKNLPVILNLYTGRKTTCCKISETFWKFDTP